MKEKIVDSELHGRLIDFLNRKKEASDKFWEGRTKHPITLKPLQEGDRPEVFPKGATDQELDEFSARTGVSLPSGLREWLKITNGTAGYFGIPPVQRDCNIEEIWGYYPEWKEKAWIPIARDGCGNYYVQFVPLADNPSIQPVAFVESIGDSVYVVASDALRFVLFQMEEDFGIHAELAKAEGLEEFWPRWKLEKDAPDMLVQAWPFNKKYMLFRDPQLAYIKNLPMPWK
jgi:hypothetical protein